MPTRNAPDWFPYFGGYPIEISEHQVVFRYPAGLDVAYAMSLNDYYAVVDLARTMEQRARLLKKIGETLSPATAAGSGALDLDWTDTDVVSSGCTNCSEKK